VVRRLRRTADYGGIAAEYALLASLIAALIVAIVVAIGHMTKTSYSNSCATYANQVGSSCAS
jgi:Flp pilus assembly pilin Flp